MKLEDAKLYFPLINDQDLIDAYEEALFLQKIFFLTHFPITSTFEPRVEKLRKIEEAYLLLGGEKSKTEVKLVTLKEFRGEIISDIFNTYQVNTNAIKLAVMNCYSAISLTEYAMLLLENIRLYAKFWELGLNGDDVLVSNQPDPMVLLKAIEDFEMDSNASFSAINKLDKQNPLYRESIRLSLWSKLDQNKRGR